MHFFKVEKVNNVDTIDSIAHWMKYKVNGIHARELCASK